MTSGAADKPLKLKDSFKGTDLYKRGVIYINERDVNRNENVRSFADIRVSQKSYEYSIPTGSGVSEAILTGGAEVQQIAEAQSDKCSGENHTVSYRQECHCEESLLCFQFLEEIPSAPKIRPPVHRIG